MKIGNLVVTYIKKRSILRNPSTIIGEKLRLRREILGLLQQDLSDISGVSIRTLQMVEQGKGNPSLETLLRIVDVLGLQLEIIVKPPRKGLFK